jgi:predicted ribosome quality control (RQC) complex YloA/Tae2 family protein
MAFDGITMTSIVAEMNEKLLGGRVDKIYQPLEDEVLFTVRNFGNSYKILASANSACPRIHMVSSLKENPPSPPLFCMVLRKYLGGGRIIKITQPNFERILILEIETMNELGDITAKKLIIEIMGKHSNLILTDENDKILDSIKRISHDKSSVREVLPGKIYQFPPSQNKSNPLELNQEHFLTLCHQQGGQKLQELIYKNYTGISPIMASEICHLAGLDASAACEQLTEEKEHRLFSSFQFVINQILQKNFSPEILYRPNSHGVLDFSVLPMTQFEGYEKQKFSSPSDMLEHFYQEKNSFYHIKQKSKDIHHLVSSRIERCLKKKEILEKTRQETTDMELWKLKGELITANIYAITKGMTTFRAINFYEEALPEIEISLDPMKTPSENAQGYFKKYNKAKRTLAALVIQENQNNQELQYLESVLTALEHSENEADLAEIRAELEQSGIAKKKSKKTCSQQRTKKSKPLHFVSSEGFDIYVGKNNHQNDDLTLHFAENTDIWMHTKNIPGSHVIIRTNGQEIPPTTLLEAANLAAFFSKAKDSSNVPVDYALRKHVKKPNGAKPGMVIYDKNKTIYITPDESVVKKISTTSPVSQG